MLRPPVYIMPKSMRGRERPVGIAQKLACQGYHISLAFFHDIVCLLRLGNQAYCRSRNACLTPNLLCERYLVSWREWHFRQHIAARRNIYQIHAMLFQCFRNLNCILDGHATFGPISCGETDQQWKFRGQNLASCINNF